MKSSLTVISGVLAAACLFSAPASAFPGGVAFPPTFDIGGGMFIAQSDCPALKIKKGDQLSSAADESHFQIMKFASGAGTDDTVVVSYHVPEDGNYVFRGSGGLVSASEFRGETPAGAFLFKLDDQTGNLDITSSSMPRCVLTNNTGG